MRRQPSVRAGLAARTRPLLRKQAGQVGMGEADCWLGLSDGGNGLENFLKTNFPGPLEFDTALIAE